MSLWLCVEQRECFEKTNDKKFKLFVVGSFLFHTWIMIWCMLVVESLRCNNTQTLNSHQIQLECFQSTANWWWQNVYKPLNFYGTIDRCTPNSCAVTRFLFRLRCLRWYFNSIVSSPLQQTWMESFFKQKSVFASFCFNYYFQFIIIVIIFCTLLTSMSTVFCHCRSTVNFSFDVCVRNNHIFSFVGFFWGLLIWKRITISTVYVRFCRGKKSFFCVILRWVFVFARWIIDGVSR